MNYKIDGKAQTEPVLETDISLEFGGDGVGRTTVDIIINGHLVAYFTHDGKLRLLEDVPKSCGLALDKNGSVQLELP